MVNFDLVCLITLSILYIFFVIMLSTKKEEIKYFRDIPKLPSALISYYDKGKIDDKSIYLTLLDLISKGYYKIENNKLKWGKSSYFSYDKKDLYEFEITLIDFINSILITEKSIPIQELQSYLKSNLSYNKKIAKFFKEIKQAISKTYGFVGKRMNNIIILISIMFYYLIIFSKYYFNFNYLSLQYFLIIFILSYVLYNFKFSIVNIISTFILMCLFLYNSLVIYYYLGGPNIWMYLIMFFNPVLIISNIVILNKDFYNKKQLQIIDEIKGLKKFLNDFTNMDKRDLKYINFFEKYYAVAVALDVKIENPYNFNFDDSNLDTLTAFEVLQSIANNINYLR